MTELQTFMQECKDRGDMSLSDHLTLSGFDTDHAKRKSMDYQATRALIDDVRYKGMLGTVIFPSTNTRGSWANGVERRDDQVARPSFSTSMVLSNTVGPILDKDDWRFQATDPAIRGAIKAVATSSIRRQEAVANGLIRQNDELDYMKERLASSLRDSSAKDARIAFLEEQNRGLLSVVISQKNGIVSQ